MLVPDRELATGAAAMLVLEMMQRTVAARTSPGKLLVYTTAPIFWIRRNAPAIRMFGAARVNRILRPLNSKIDSPSYNAVDELRK